MSLNNDTPISGLPDKVQEVSVNDLLVISQNTGGDQYFTAKITVAMVYALFMSNINISDVKTLSDTLANMQLDIDSKLSGAHTHVISEITGLQLALDGKAASSHIHAIGQITGLQAALDSKLDSLTHTHSISQVIGLQLALNQKASVSHGHDISDISGLILALSNKLETNLKGAVNGVAELDSGGRVPMTQSHVFIIEKPNVVNFPTVGEAGKFYVAASTGVAYRWNGTSYTPLGTGVAYLSLGETSGDAYRGDRGKTAYDHSQSAHAPSDAQKNVQADWLATSGDALIRNKPLTMPPSAHSHPYDSISGVKPPVDAQKNVQADWLATSGDAYIKNKPLTFTPSGHTQGYDTITGVKPPSDAQKNSDITKAEIEAKLIGTISSHNHDDIYLKLAGGGIAGDLDISGILTVASLTIGSGSVGAYGYLPLGNGIILQWGPMISGLAVDTIPFPVTFPAKMLIVVPVPDSFPGYNNRTVAITGYSLTNFVWEGFTSDVNDYVGGRWLALGY